MHFSLFFVLAFSSVGFSAVSTMKDLVVNSRFHQTVAFSGKVQRQLNEKQVIVSDGTETFLVDFSKVGQMNLKEGQAINVTGEWALGSTETARKLGAATAVNAKSVTKTE